MSTAVDCSSLGLPVELLSFNVRKNTSSVELNWRTATEINNDYFTLERSSDGRSFTELGTVTGAGNSQKEIDYSFTDYAPTTGTNYYRLKQVDFDGSYTFSDVRSVEFDLDKEQILIYPNPLKGSLLNVSFFASSDLDTEVNVEVIDVKGTLLLQQQSFMEKGTHTLQYSLAEYPAGVYWLRFNWGANTHVEKVVKF